MRESVRSACRAAAMGRIHLLERLADDETAPPRWRLQALALLAKYGVGTSPDRDGIQPEAVTELVKALADATEPFVDAADLARLGRAWTAVVRDQFPNLGRTGDGPG